MTEIDSTRENPQATPTKAEVEQKNKASFSNRDEYARSQDAIEAEFGTGFEDVSVHEAGLEKPRLYMNDGKSISRAEGKQMSSFSPIVPTHALSRLLMLDPRLRIYSCIFVLQGVHLTDL